MYIHLMFCQIPVGMKAGPQSQPKSGNEDKKYLTMYLYMFMYICMCMYVVPDCGFRTKFLEAFGT